MECFLKNRLNASIDKMYVFMDIETKMDHAHSKIEKIIFIDMDSRPSFDNIFQFINRVSSEDDVNIIANSDIYLDEESIWLIKKWIKENECFALARWDTYFDGKPIHFNRRDTNDVWIFKGKIKDIPDCDFTMGIPGCDNAICERIKRAGYVVKNPSMDIKTYHLHSTGVRNYHGIPPVPKPYLLITPHSLLEKNIIYAIVK